MILDYLKHQLNAGNAHNIHSPFVYRIYTEAIKKNQLSPFFSQIERQRKTLIRSKEHIKVTDFGAGSRVHHSNQRRVSQIARFSTATPKQGRLLHSLASFMKAKYALELGTSLGLGSLYLANALSEKGKLWTIEGCPSTAAIAEENFQQWGQNNINLSIGKIEEKLPSVLEQIPHLDLAFLDANHRYLPTLEYFELCLQKTHQDSLLIFDDIHWSKEMQQAWQKIYQDERVGISIDLFYFGLVFMRQKQPKQHFRLRY